VETACQKAQNQAGAVETQIHQTGTKQICSFAPSPKQFVVWPPSRLLSGRSGPVVVVASETSRGCCFFFFPARLIKDASSEVKGLA
jgi:hypothetical protein